MARSEFRSTSRERNFSGLREREGEVQMLRRGRTLELGNERRKKNPKNPHPH